MKHTELKAFVKKYNSEFAITGYSKMNKQQLMDAVTAKLKQSRQEIRKEWESMHKSDAKPAGSARDRARSKIAARYGKSSSGQGSYLKGKAKPKAKAPVKAAAKPKRRVALIPVKAAPKTKKRVTISSTATKKIKDRRTATEKADDAYHAQHKGGESVSSNAKRMVANVVARAERRAKVREHTKLSRRIRGY